MANARHRRLLIVRGSRARTEAEARTLVANLDPAEVLWVGAAAIHSFRAVTVRNLATLLGRSFDAVVVDAHDGYDADALGQAHGLVWGGGALIVRRPAVGQAVPDGPRRLAVEPFSVADVGRRFEAHVERVFADHAVDEEGTEPLRPATHATVGSAEQSRVVQQLVAAWSGERPCATVLTADRGRGKSSALGLALAQLPPATRVAVSAASEDAVQEVLRFAPGARFAPLHGLPDQLQVIVIDEAAQVPLPVLRRVVRQHPAAHLAFATTTHGYEGTGRGFSLRFVDWLVGQRRLCRSELAEPIRWGAGDPVERAVFAALLLDCELPDVEGIDATQIRYVELDRDALLDRPQQLRELLGLLVHAHYRTTPGDLHRMLDAPNLTLHAAMADGHVVGATVVAKEGALSTRRCAQVASGAHRLNGHALADAIVAHLGFEEAGRLAMARSVRIAVHPALRRRGVASALVEHVHRQHQPDLFGTMFGASAGLVAFRRRLGYAVVRLSAARGARTGEPSVMMLRPRTAESRALVDELRRELAHELPTQLELLAADGELQLDPQLVAGLRADLPAVAGRDGGEVQRLVCSYANGPRTFESCATAIEHFVRRHEAALAELGDAQQAVIRGRVLARRGWLRVTADAGLPTVRASMRTLRQAIRAMLG